MRSAALVLAVLAACAGSGARRLTTGEPTPTGTAVETPAANGDRVTFVDQQAVAVTGLGPEILLPPEGDSDAEVRRRACSTVEALRFPHAFDPLARIFRESSDPGARTASLRAIARIDTREAAELLLGVFQHEGKAERTAAAEALKRARGGTFLEVARSEAGTLDDRVRQDLREVFQARGEML